MESTTYQLEKQLKEARAMIEEFYSKDRKRKQLLSELKSLAEVYTSFRSEELEIRDRVGVLLENVIVDLQNSN